MGCVIRDVWALRENGQIIDDAGLNQAAVDRVFVAVNVNLARNKLNPERSVCRFELIESIVRFASEKFVRSECARTRGCRPCPCPKRAACVAALCGVLSSRFPHAPFLSIP